MKLLLAAVFFSSCLVSIAGETASLELTYRQLAARRTVILSWDDGQGYQGDLQLSKYHNGEDESGIRFRTAGPAVISFGRFIYAGPYRIFLDPGRLFLPHVLSRDSHWSLYISELSRQKFGLSVSGGTGNTRWDLLFDHERSSAGASMRLDYETISLGTAVMLGWDPSREDSGDWVRDPQHISGPRLLCTGWISVEEHSWAIGASAGISGSPCHVPGSWVQVSCTWVFSLMEGSAGMYFSDSRVWSITGDAAQKRMEVSSRGLFFPDHPVRLLLDMHYVLDVIPPWPRQSFLPGEYSWGWGVEAVSGLTTVSCSVESDLIRTVRGEKQLFRILGSLHSVKGLLQWGADVSWEREKSFSVTGSAKKQLGQWEVSSALTMESGGSEGPAVRGDISVTGTAPWGLIRAGFSPGKGVSLGIEASLVIYPR